MVRIGDDLAEQPHHLPSSINRSILQMPSATRAAAFRAHPSHHDGSPKRRRVCLFDIFTAFCLSALSTSDTDFRSDRVLDSCPPVAQSVPQDGVHKKRCFSVAARHRRRYVYFSSLLQVRICGR